MGEQSPDCDASVLLRDSDRGGAQAGASTQTNSKELHNVRKGQGGGEKRVLEAFMTIERKICDRDAISV